MLTPEDEKFIEEWQNSRRIGYFKHTFIIGPLTGLILGIITVALKLLYTPIDEVLTVSMLIQVLLGGILMQGAFIWPWSEHKYKKIMAQISEKENKPTPSPFITKNRIKIDLIQSKKSKIPSKSPLKITKPKD